MALEPNWQAHPFTVHTPQGDMLCTPAKWKVHRAASELATITITAGDDNDLIIWQLTDEGQSDHDAIEQAIAYSILDYNDE